MHSFAAVDTVSSRFQEASAARLTASIVSEMSNFVRKLVRETSVAAVDNTSPQHAVLHLSIIQRPTSRLLRHSAATAAAAANEGCITKNWRRSSKQTARISNDDVWMLPQQQRLSQLNELYELYRQLSF